MGLLDKLVGEVDLKGFQECGERLEKHLDRLATAQERCAAAAEEYLRVSKIALGIVEEAAAEVEAPAKKGGK